MQPVYEALFGFHVFGLGFVTSMAFIIGTGAVGIPAPSYLSPIFDCHLCLAAFCMVLMPFTPVNWPPVSKHLRWAASAAGVFVSSWLGGLLLQVADWIIKKLPLIKHIYSAAKQVRRTILCPGVKF